MFKSPSKPYEQMIANNNGSFAQIQLPSENYSQLFPNALNPEISGGKSDHLPLAIQPNMQYIDLTKLNTDVRASPTFDILVNNSQMDRESYAKASPPHRKNYLVIGGGPIGMYLAYTLLKDNDDAYVSVLEKRGFNRPQVITIPFSVAKRIPLGIKRRLWDDKKTRSRIFKNPVCGPKFWPEIGYEQWPFINIQTFQIEFLKYLTRINKYKSRFSFFEKDFDPASFDISQAADLFPKNEILQLDAVFCTCSLFSTVFRKEPHLALTKETHKGHGLYWTYHNSKKETYCRKGKPLQASQISSSGILYAACNNKANNVQIYTSPKGTLKELFETIPSEFMKRAAYGSRIQPLTTGYNPDLNQQTTLWFNKYVNEVKSLLYSHDIPYPSDLYDINVYYAERKEYYFEKVTTRLETKGTTEKIPLFFIGDSAGSTDYTWGLSAGRGLIAIGYIRKYLRFGIEAAIIKYQNYWDRVVAQEFNKDVSLTSEPFMTYKYMVKGRAPFLSWRDFTSYVSAHENYANKTN